MLTRTLTVILNVGIFVLLVVLVVLAAGMRRSLRRIEHEERGPVARTRLPYPVTDVSPWQTETNQGAWILVPPGPCSHCGEGPFYHRFLSKEGCEGALAEWNASLNLRPSEGPSLSVGIGVLGNCEARPPRQ